MARARNIKPGFFKNEFLAEISPFARLLFIGLWTLADREGRLEDRPKKIRAEIFPFETDCDIDGMLDELEKGGFLIRYELGRDNYIQIVNFVKHQDPHYKEKASEILPPEGHQNQMAATNVTRTQRRRILARDEFSCNQCGSEDHLCIDHIVPVSRGGDSSDENLQVLCMSCNAKKSNKLDGEGSAKKRRKDREASEFDPMTNQVQPDVDSSSAKQSGASPSDCLIPDSLNTDSLQSDSSERSRLLADFETLWQSFDGTYGEKGARNKAEAEFLKLKPDRELFQTMIDGLCAQIEDKAVKESQGQFCPNFPHVVRWIKDRRWTDEISRRPVTQGRPGSSKSAASDQAARDYLAGIQGGDGAGMADPGILEINSGAGG